MSNLPQIIITAESEAVLAKKQIWAEVGFTVHNTNLQLESKAKAALGLLEAVPTTIDQVVSAEQILKQVKEALNVIETDRKSVTSKFDAVTSALMTHEKSVKDALPAYQAAIISVKKAHELEQAKKLAEIEAAKIAKEMAINFINSEYARIKDLIADQCQKAFEYALGKDITGERLDSYLVKVKANKTATDLTINKPDNITQENFDSAYKQLDAPSGEDFVAYLAQEVDKKFQFYSVALKNKEAAIEASKQAELKAQQDRLNEVANASVAARLETIATSTAEVVSDVKGLKKKYEIDMPETDSNALLIITAFVTNYKLVSDGVRVTQAFNLSVKQMASALAWYKNKDNDFACTGINFKIVERL